MLKPSCFKRAVAPSVQCQCNLEGRLPQIAMAMQAVAPKKERWARSKESSKSAECANLREAQPLLRHCPYAVVSQ